MPSARKQPKAPAGARRLRPAGRSRRRLIEAGLTAALIAVAVVIAIAVGAGRLPVSLVTTPAKVWPGSQATHTSVGPGHLSVSRDTAALALNVLIANDGDDEMVAVTPIGQVVYRLHQPDLGQVFLSRTGRTLIAALGGKESEMVMRRVDNREFSYVYGRAGQPGAGADQLNDPQTALEDASGQVAIADSGNCRVVFVATDSNRPAGTLGVSGDCAHHVDGAPVTFGDPVAAFPTADGGLVVTERDPADVDLFNVHAGLVASLALSGIAVPSDANETASGRIVVADRTEPGKVEELDRASGAVLWSYGPAAGAGELDRPALAQVLADGDVLVSDSGNDRVIVIDPKSDAIVWQYGHKGVAGTGLGYLDDPGSATLVPIGP